MKKRSVIRSRRLRYQTRAKLERGRPPRSARGNHAKVTVAGTVAFARSTLARLNECTRAGDGVRSTFLTLSAILDTFQRSGASAIEAVGVVCFDGPRAQLARRRHGRA